ncbi:sensor histidine kinase [Phyllobacterium endophyticum]|uniref:sensor histidine kinase n=1 Tax=Phyllobacterium endophyticum TaxID=1149773 RepID=UPI0011CBFB5F|nr:ATP-binding protein [Phyllobacterium endophyticum]TXR48402.1 GHKL domain-containing protein [Phyllobacterium endophyticum]
MARFAPLAAAVIAVAVFILDTLTTFDIAIAVLYVVVVLLALNFAGKIELVAIGAGCMGLTLLSFLLSHGHQLPADSIGRCLVSLAAIGITTFLAFRVKAAIGILADSEQRYRSIFLATGVGILQMDFTGLKNAFDRYKSNNLQSIDDIERREPGFARSALKMFKLTNANNTALNMFNAPNVGALELLLPSLVSEDMEGKVWKLLASLWAGNQSYEAEAVLKMSDGRQLIFLYNVAVPFDRPALDMVLISIMDVTARREAENELHAARSQLAHVARVATLGELTVSIAHELNQPLAAVVTNGGAGLRWLKREVPDLTKVQSSMESMVADATRASDVIKHLRGLSVKSPPDPDNVDLNEVAEETITLLQREIDINQVSLKVDLAEDLPKVVGDRVQLQQVVLNLLLNAIQAMAHVPESRRELLVRSSREESAVLFSVHDTGPGIPPEIASNLFDPFYTTKPDGMGMGLSICRSILTVHGGGINASSEPGAGTTFEFTIPFNREIG